MCNGATILIRSAIENENITKKMRIYFQINVNNMKCLRLTTYPEDVTYKMVVLLLYFLLYYVLLCPFCIAVFCISIYFSRYFDKASLNIMRRANPQKKTTETSIANIR